MEICGLHRPLLICIHAEFLGTAVATSDKILLNWGQLIYRSNNTFIQKTYTTGYVRSLTGFRFDLQGK